MGYRMAFNPIFDIREKVRYARYQISDLYEYRTIDIPSRIAVSPLD